MNFKDLTGKTIREGFNEFNKENPEVYREFEKQALRAISVGRKKISAKQIINWIRWNKFIESSDKNFRINDAFHSYYARYFAEKHPEYSDVFEYRKLRNEVEAPYMVIEKDGQLSFL